MDSISESMEPQTPKPYPTAEENYLKGLQCERDRNLKEAMKWYSIAWKMKPELTLHRENFIVVCGKTYDMYGNCLSDLEYVGSEEDTVPTQKFELWQNSSKNNEKSSNLAILVITGAFCPIHNMHIQMLEIAKDFMENSLKINVCAGFLSPSHQFYVAPKLARQGIEAWNSKDRFEMAKLACSSSSWISASSWEINQSDYVNPLKVAQNIHKFFKEKYNKTNFSTFLVCGSDTQLFFAELMPEFPETSGVIIVQRGNSTTVPTPPENSKIFSLCSPTLELSSTEIRKKIMEGKDIANDVGPLVCEYISKNGLQITKYPEDRKSVV